MNHATQRPLLFVLILFCSEQSSAFRHTFSIHHSPFAIRQTDGVTDRLSQLIY